MEIRAMEEAVPTVTILHWMDARPTTTFLVVHDWVTYVPVLPRVMAVLPTHMTSWPSVVIGRNYFCTAHRVRIYVRAVSVILPTCARTACRWNAWSEWWGDEHSSSSTKKHNLITKPTITTPSSLTTIHPSTYPTMHRSIPFSILSIHPCSGMPHVSTGTHP